MIVTIGLEVALSRYQRAQTPHWEAYEELDQWLMGSGGVPDTFSESVEWNGEFWMLVATERECGEPPRLRVAKPNEIIGRIVWSDYSAGLLDALRPQLDVLAKRFEKALNEASEEMGS